MYQLGSHNSWSYLPVKKWWMKPLRFTAQCQDVNIITQYSDYNVRCFDLRVRFDKHKLIIAHGIIEYNISEQLFYSTLDLLNRFGDVSIRVVHEIRNKRQHTEERINQFITFCSQLEEKYPNIKFWYGMNLLSKQTIDYKFDYNPSCEEIYSSVCKPKLIDDWYPRWFAKNNNEDILKKGTNKDILLIDFVNYGH